MVGNDTVYIGELRVPKVDLSTKAVLDTSKLPKDWSRLRIVKEFHHQGEVNKARAMKQDCSFIASLGNTGEIYIYKNDGSSNAQSDFSVLSGLEEEGFGLSWNPLRKGVLSAATG